MSFSKRAYESLDEHTVAVRNTRIRTRLAVDESHPSFRMQPKKPDEVIAFSSDALNATANLVPAATGYTKCTGEFTPLPSGFGKSLTREAEVQVFSYKSQWFADIEDVKACMLKDVVGYDPETNQIDVSAVMAQVPRVLGAQDILGLQELVDDLRSLVKNAPQTLGRTVTPIEKPAWIEEADAAFAALGRGCAARVHS